jgi:uncharacterized protein
MTDPIDPEVFVPAHHYDEHAAQFTAYDPGTRTLPVGFRFSKRYAPLSEELVFEKDTAVQLRDGTTIYTDVFRPVGDGPFPVIVSWSPYGKTSGTSRIYTMMRMLVGVDQHKLSGLMKWEAVDPARWCAAGYAVCHPDARGACRSEGDIQFFGEQEGRDAHDLIEWAATQPWCTGKVGMAGNSWLAVSQWFTAAEQPPHLAAIAPWEGFSDMYRDILMIGGIPDTGFPENIASQLQGTNEVEHPRIALNRHPLFDDYWQTKAARIENINVPAYVVASYSSTVHSVGTFRAWHRLTNPNRWLRIHDRQEWPDFYQEDNQQDLMRYFDHFLKDADNGWEETPRVRYSLLDLEGGDIINRPAPDFPPSGVTPTSYYLDSDGESLVPEKPAHAKTAKYEAAAHRGSVEFKVRFDEETVIVGHPKLKLWVEADGHDDMDIFVFLEKLNRHGHHLQVQNSGHPNPLVWGMTHFTGSVLKYHSAPGRIRASVRRLDPALSTEDVPVPDYTKVEKLKPGEIVEVEFSLYTLGLLMHPGEQLRLVITGHNIIGPPMPTAGQPDSDNHGHHIIHCGGRYDSQLVLPLHDQG